MFNYKINRMSDVTEEERLNIWKEHVADKHSNVVMIAVSGMYNSICKIENVATINIYLGEVDDKEDYYKFENFEYDFVGLTEGIYDQIDESDEEEAGQGVTYNINIIYGVHDIPGSFKKVYDKGVWYE